MENDRLYTADQITRAVSTLIKIRPAYESMLELYRKVFLAQAECPPVVQTYDFTIPDELLAIKIKDRFPLVEPSQFIIDTESSVRLFRTMCDILMGFNEQLHKPMEKLTGSLEQGSLDTGTLFAAFLQGQTEPFEDMSAEYGIDKKIAGFLVNNSLQPSLESFSRHVASFLNLTEKWGKGYCPVCGSSPFLSEFVKDGRRMLHCGFCRNTWQVERIYCPFCENRDSETLHYYEFENEEEHRVDVCDTCKNYIKTVDTRVLSRLMYPPLEDVATTHLDMRIQEMGFSNGNGGNSNNE